MVTIQLTNDDVANICFSLERDTERLTELDPGAGRVIRPINDALLNKLRERMKPLLTPR